MSIEVKKEDAVATVVMNRPEKKNALTLEMRIELGEVFERLAADDEVRAVVITGAGTDFCSGADVAGMGRADLPGSQARIRILHRAIRAIYRLDKPVVAAVRGHAVGFGWTVALASDIVIAGTSAKFAQVFRNVALAPDGGAVYLLSRLIGTARAKELVFSARQVKAEDAMLLGLANRVVPDDDLLPSAMELARGLASGPPIALAYSKRLFRASQVSSFEEFLDVEYLVQPVLQQTQDHREGVAAFMEKRKPRFEGT